MAVGFEGTSISQQRVVWPGSQGGRTPTLSEKNVVLRTVLPSKVTRESGESITVSLATSLGRTATHEPPDTRAAQPLCFLTHNSSRHPFIPARYHLTEKHTTAVGEEPPGHRHVAWIWDCVCDFRISSKTPLRGSVQESTSWLTSHDPSLRPHLDLRESIRNLFLEVRGLFVGDKNSTEVIFLDMFLRYERKPNHSMRLRAGQLWTMLFLGRK